MSGSKKIITNWVVFFLSLVTNNLWCQVTIDSIIITEEKPYALQDLDADHQSSDTFRLNTQQFLSYITSGQVQINTPGGLTTYLHRGMGNRHLPVLWQGINLQSMVNGSYDLSLIPLEIFNQSTFYQFGAPTLQGNNGFAGALNIDHNESELGSFVSASFSSLQNYQLTAKANLIGKKSKSIIGIQAGRDLNQFSYTYNQKKYNRISTDFNKLNVVSETDFYISSNQLLQVNVWWQQSDRIIPTSVSSSLLLQKQEDINFRSQISHQYFSNQHKWTNKVSYLNEKINYSTPSIDSRSEVDVLLFTSEWSELKRKDYFIGFNYRYDLARPNFYNSRKTRETWQFSGAKNLKWSESLSTNISTRQDIVDGRWMPNSWTIRTIFNKNSLNFSRNYNLPGLNDLYWPQGGNPDLKTETSLQVELKRQTSFSGLDYKISIYSNLVDNWIVWMPVSSGIWTPFNQQKVWSRGLDMQLAKSFESKGFILSPKIAYSYNQTTTTKHYTDPNLVGKQMIYIPRHKLNLSIRITKDKHFVDLSSQLTGKRYDTFDNTNPLPKIQLVDIRYAYYFKKWQLSFAINNVLNKRYNYVRFFPMPGINSTINFTYKIF